MHPVAGPLHLPRPPQPYRGLALMPWHKSQHTLITRSRSTLAQLMSTFFHAPCCRSAPHPRLPQPSQELRWCHHITPVVLLILVQFTVLRLTHIDATLTVHSPMPHAPCCRSAPCSQDSSTRSRAACFPCKLKAPRCRPLSVGKSWAGPASATCPLTASTR